MRKKLFIESQHDIEIINSSNENTFKADNNFFSDWTHEEYKKLLGTWPRKNKLQMVPTISADEVLPKSVDWCEKGAVTPVKNQE